MKTHEEDKKPRRSYRAPRIVERRRFDTLSLGCAAFIDEGNFLECVINTDGTPFAS